MRILATKQAVYIDFLVMAGCPADSGCVSTKPVHYYKLGAAAPPANQGKSY